MRKLIYFVASTLDGFIAGHDGSWDFFPVDGEHQEDISIRYPESIPTHVRAVIGMDPENLSMDAVVMGRMTYQPALDIGVTSPYAHLRQYVFSRTLGPSEDPAVEITSDDPLDRVQKLKTEAGKGIWICGGGNLAYQLLPEIDELVIKLYPIVIGSGIPLFAGEFRPNYFTLADHTGYDNGVALLTYTRKSE